MEGPLKKLEVAYGRVVGLTKAYNNDDDDDDNNNNNSIFIYLLITIHKTILNIKNVLMTQYNKTIHQSSSKHTSG